MPEYLAQLPGGADSLTGPGGCSGAGEAAAGLFGPHASLLPPPEWAQESLQGLPALTDNPVFKTLVILILVGYCATAYYYRDSLAALVKSLKIRLYSDKLLEEQSRTFSQFLRMLLGTGLVACCVLAVRCAARYADSELFGAAPQWAYLLIPIAVAILLLLVGLYQRLLLGAVAGLVRTPLFFDRLWLLRRMLAAVGTLFVMPPVLFLALDDGPSAVFFGYLTGMLGVAFVVFFVFRTNRYFVGQKISFLYWFLYLCAVEIFPISVFAALAWRYA